MCLFIYFSSTANRKLSLSPKLFLRLVSPQALLSPDRWDRRRHRRRDGRAGGALASRPLLGSRLAGSRGAAGARARGEEAAGALGRSLPPFPRCLEGAWVRVPPRHGGRRMGGRRGVQPVSTSHTASAAGTTRWAPTRAPCAETHLSAAFLCIFLQ